MATDIGRITGIHLDLKYLMPNKAYLLEWVRRLPEWGLNAVLIEYEDMFPYEKYPFLCGKDAFTPDELREFLATARAAGVTCIPLVQSLSHLEFALSHEELAHLREAPDIPTQLCPSKEESVEFVRDLMAEVIEYHREDPYFHCGGDETWHLGTCEACADWMAGAGPIQMWADHQRKIIHPIRDAGKRPILWDDIFWKDFDAIEEAALPEEVILHAWNYNITSIESESGDPDDLEFGGAGRKLKQIEIYKRAGHDCLACPCLNYGQLIPRMAKSIANTRAWAQKIRATGMMGMLNSAWSCFHIPLQAMEILTAATAELCADPDADVGFAWQREWLEKEFGGSAEDVPEGLQALGELWEIPMPEYGRPFTPLPYGYMNMVLHYPGRQDERRKRGGYPNDWSEIDFCAMYRNGMAAIREGDLVPEFERLDRILVDYATARDALKAMASSATRHKEKAEMLAFLAEFKLAGARVFSHLMRGEGDREALRAAWSALKGPLGRFLADAFEPEAQHRMIRAWWEPLDVMLAE